MTIITLTILIMIIIMTIIIVIKIIITVIMKITIVLKLIKSFAKVIILKCKYVQILTIPSKKFKKTSYRPTLPQQVQRSMVTKNKDLHTLPSILRPKGAIVFRALLHRSSLWISFVNKCYWDITYKTIMIAAATMLIGVVAYMFHHIDVSYNYFHNCSVWNGIRRQFDPSIVFYNSYRLKDKLSTCRHNQIFG